MYDSVLPDIINNIKLWFINALSVADQVEYISLVGNDNAVDDINYIYMLSAVRIFTSVSYCFQVFVSEYESGHNEAILKWRVPVSMVPNLYRRRRLSRTTVR